MLAAYAAPANSDYRPVLQVEAARTRFLQSSAAGPLVLAHAPLPILEMLYGERAHIGEPRPDARGLVMAMSNEALEIHRILVERAAPPLAARFTDARLPLATLQTGGAALCGNAAAPEVLDQLQWLAEHTLAHLGTRQRQELWVEARWTGCPDGKLAANARERLSLYRAIAERDADSMYRQARAMLEAGRPSLTAWRRYLLLAAMLGAHASDRSDAAAELWRTHAGRLFAGTDTPPYAIYLSDLKPGDWKPGNTKPGTASTAGAAPTRSAAPRRD